jgi:hypothetical protein
VVTTRELLEAVLALPIEERARFRDELDASLPVDEDEDPQFVAMIRARIAAVEAGEPGIPAEQVFAELRARYGTPSR